MVFRQSFANKQGVTAMSVSADSRFVAFTSGNQNHDHPSRLGVLDTSSNQIVADHVIDGCNVYDIAYIGSDTILAGVYGGEFGEFDAGLLLIETDSGAIRWREHLGGIGVNLAVHPSQELVAVGFKSPDLRFYKTSDWSQHGSHTFKVTEDVSERVTSLAFMHAGDRLAFGTSSGRFDIIEISA